MALKLNSSSGGSVTLQEPTTASNYTLTVPAQTSTILTKDSTSGMAVPAFSAYLASNSSTISDATWVKISLNTEEFDTNNNFDSSSNYRFTPTVAGYYQITASIQFDDTGNPVNDIRTAIYKNGSIHRIAMGHVTSGDLWGTASISALIYMNGSTDYLELYGLVYNGGGSAYIVGFSASKGTWMSGHLVRAA